MFVWLSPAEFCERSWPNWRNLPSTKWDGLWWPSSSSCVECGGTRMVPQGDASFPKLLAVVYAPSAACPPRHPCPRRRSCLRCHGSADASTSHSSRHCDELQREGIGWISWVPQRAEGFPFYLRCSAVFWLAAFSSWRRHTQIAMATMRALSTNKTPTTISTNQVMSTPKTVLVVSSGNGRRMWIKEAFGLPPVTGLTLTEILHRLIGVVATMIDTIAEQIGINAELTCGAGEVLAGMFCKWNEVEWVFYVCRSLSNRFSTHWDPSPMLSPAWNRSHRFPSHL